MGVMFREESRFVAGIPFFSDGYKIISRIGTWVGWDIYRFVCLLYVIRKTTLHRDTDR